MPVFHEITTEDQNPIPPTRIPPFLNHAPPDPPILSDLRQAAPRAPRFLHVQQFALHCRIRSA